MELLWLSDDAKGIVEARPEKSDLLTCVTCYRHLCCGVGSIAYPYGHSRAHALKKKHWFDVLCCDPDQERGYCFKCNAEVPMPVKFGEGDNEIGIQVIRCIVRQLPALPPSVGQTEAVTEVNPKVVEMTAKVEAESCPSGSGVDLADRWPSYESRLSDAQGYAIRGIPNLGNTCYMSAVLQCLFVLGKLRERMLALDRQKSPLAKVLKELFVEASAAGDVLNPIEVLNCVHKHRVPYFKVGTMEDSQDLLTALRTLAPAVMDSIFGFEMARTLSCKKCGHLSALDPFHFQDLSMGFPSKGHPTKSAALPQTSECPRSQKGEIAVQLFPEDVQRNLQSMQIVSASGYFHVNGSEVIVEETHKPLDVDSTEAQRISRSKDVVQSPLQIQEGKSADSLTADSISIEHFLSLFSEGPVKWCCPNCSKDHEEPSASQSKNGEQVVGSGSEDTRIAGDQNEQSDRTACHSKESEVLRPLPFPNPNRSPSPAWHCMGIGCGKSRLCGCLGLVPIRFARGKAGIRPAEKQTDLLGTNQSADASKQHMMHLETTVKQSDKGRTASLLKDGRNEQKDDVGDNICIYRFTMLPPVLTLHLKRTSYDTVGRKISGHVRFMEYLDVERFMDPSSVDKGSTRYRLAGVVEHIGVDSLQEGHYIAYVRARRLGNQQEGSSCSSSWFCADDRQIRQVTLEQVLNSEAYILFYERMVDQDISGIIRHQN